MSRIIVPKIQADRVSQLLGCGAPVARLYTLRDTGSGITVCEDLSPNHRTIPITSAVMGNTKTIEGSPAPYLDGDNDYFQETTNLADINIGSAKLSFFIDLKVFNAGIWTEGARRFAFQLRGDAGNYIYIEIPAANDSITFKTAANLKTATYNHTPISSIDWIRCGMTIDLDLAPGDVGQVYVNGVNVGVMSMGFDEEYNVAWTTLTIGAVTNFTLEYYGYLANFMIANAALSQSAMERLTRIS